MSTLARILATLIVAIFMTSCNLNMLLNEGVEGNGNVITKKRDISEKFNTIEVSHGLKVYLTQDQSPSLVVEADENLHEIINTEVVNGILEITTDVNIKSAKAKHIILSTNSIDKIDTSSGAYLHSENTLKAENLVLESSSGSHINVVVEVKSLDCETSSGSGITLAGQTDNFTVEASSGSYIEASNLEAKISSISASSGANISVNTTDELTADASSGANITYSGHPKKVNKSDGVSGRISRD